MNRCPKCNIEILDDTAICPLCKRVLERDSDVNGENKSEMYPRPKRSFKAMRFAKRITVYAAVVVELVAIMVNYMTYNGFKWSVLVGAGLIFGCFSLIFCTSKNKSLQRKIVTEMVVAQVLIIFIDSYLDFNMWSINIGLPSVVVGVDIAMLVLMIINASVWIEYLYSIIWILIDSILCLLLCIAFGEYFPLLPIIALGVTAVFVAGIIVVGDKGATSELHRRFHI